MSDDARRRLPAEFAEAKSTSLAREPFASDSWITGIAIVKYVPRSFRVKQVQGMAFFTEAKHKRNGESFFKSTSTIT
jgi:hypothetical protein